MNGDWNRAQEWVANVRRQGYPQEKIRAALRESGWPDDQIEKLMMRAAVPPPPPPPSVSHPAARPSAARIAIIIAVAALVVLPAIVGFLAGILFPVFARARAKAQETSCLVNVKQLMMGQHMYASDYDEVLPPKGEWPELLFPYMRNEEIFLCPCDARDYRQQSGDLETSYTMSEGMSQYYLRAIRNPAELGVLFDGTELYGGHQAGAFRHHGGLNLGYVDGHCMPVAEEQFRQVPLEP